MTSSQKLDLYDNVYGDFASRAETEVRRAAFGEDIGQSSWLTARDWLRFADQAGVKASSRVLRALERRDVPYPAPARRSTRLASSAASRWSNALHRRAVITGQVPPGENERLIGKAGFTLIAAHDETEAAEVIARNWRAARERYRDELIAREGAANFDGLQRFLACVHDLSAERRLSRFCYIAEVAATQRQ